METGWPVRLRLHYSSMRGRPVKDLHQRPPSCGTPPVTAPQQAWLQMLKQAETI